MANISINDILVDDCLLRLFTEFTLAEQLGNLRAVCPRWRNLLETYTLPGRHSLKLFGAQEPAIKDYCRTVTGTFSATTDQEEFTISDDDLIVGTSHFTHLFATELARLMPNLHRITVWFDGDSPFRELPALLERLPGLTRVSLLGQIKFDPVNGEDRYLSRLCGAINKLPALTTLDLLPVNMIRSEAAVQLITRELSNVLPRLSTLSLKPFGCRGDLGPLLVQLGSCCRKLRLESLFFYDLDDLQEMLMANGSLRDSLEELRVSGIGRQFLRFTAAYFGSLKSLSLGFSGVPEIEALLLEDINEGLPHLVDLCLENTLLEMNLNLAELANLTGIKRLTLSGLDLGRFSFDDYRFLCILGTAFPGLESFTLRCINSIDENEAVGAFEFAADCFRVLRAKDVRLERLSWPRIAGRHGR